MRVVELPPELAPVQRARVEQLVAEVGLASHPKPRGGQDLRPVCHVCRRRGGPMSVHHVVAGDDGSVVAVHKSCHRKLHVRSRET